jgi:hypothetical protein
MIFKLILALIVLFSLGDADRSQAPSARSTSDTAESLKRLKPRWIVSERVVKAERVAIFLRGSSTSNEITQVLKDLHELKKPASRYFPRRLEKNPSQSTDFLENICEQNGAGMFGFGSSTKRRRDHLILGRLYNGKILDFFEFHARSKKSNATGGIEASVDSAPCFVFLGDSWSKDNCLNEFKNFLIDGFGIRHDKQVGVRALERVMVCSALNSSRVEIRHFVNRLQVLQLALLSYPFPIATHSLIPHPASRCP